MPHRDDLKGKAQSVVIAAPRLDQPPVLVVQVEEPFQLDESGTNRGRLRGQVLLIGCVGEVGVPAPVVVGEGVVEYPGADLQ